MQENYRHLLRKNSKARSLLSELSLWHSIPRGPQFLNTVKKKTNHCVFGFFSLSWKEQDVRSWVIMFQQGTWAQDFISLPMGSGASRWQKRSSSAHSTCPGNSFWQKTGRKKVFLNGTVAQVKSCGFRTQVSCKPLFKILVYSLICGWQRLDTRLVLKI